MSERPKILADHKRRGKILVPPIIHYLGSITEVSWVDNIIPEVVWIELIQNQQGMERGVELITSMARAARDAYSSETRQIFTFASNYSKLSQLEWEKLRNSLAKTGNLFLIQKSLDPLISLFSECPLRGLFATAPTTDPSTALSIISDAVSALLQRSDCRAMMAQATVIWLAFDADVLKVKEGLALANFPEIENYPDTELSRKVGSGIRAAINAFAGKDNPHSPDTRWAQYFWSHALAITPCEFDND